MNSWGQLFYNPSPRSPVLAIDEMQYLADGLWVISGEGKGQKQGRAGDFRSELADLISRWNCENSWFFCGLAVEIVRNRVPMK